MLMLLAVMLLLLLQLLSTLLLLLTLLLVFFESQLSLWSLLLLAPLLCLCVPTVVNITSLPSADVNVAAVATSFLLLP
jgi:hypothetical protein